jgi:phosphate transport system substrate-binding protein
MSLSVKPRRTRLMAAAGLLAALGVVAAGCGSSSKSTTPTSVASGSTTTTASVPAGTINGAGSTFQANFDEGALGAFDQMHSGVTINYQGVGSGTGQTDLAHNLVDFAGTDSIPKEPALFAAGGGLYYFPTVVAPITLSYNLSGVAHLTLSANTIAGIFDGSITKWNAAQIAADNPGVNLPSQSITPVHRSDSSGTTSNFTKYLSKAAPTVWKLGHGTTVNWPGGQAGSGNPGVATVVKQTTGAIGYVDFSTAVADNLHFASIKNSAGQPIAPSLAGASAAADGATVAADLTYDPTDASGASAYPITSPTWIIVYKHQSNPTKTAILKAFLTYLLTTAQGALAQQLNYAPLPASLDQKALAQVALL